MGLFGKNKKKTGKSAKRVRRFDFLGLEDDLDDDYDYEYDDDDEYEYEDDVEEAYYQDDDGVEEVELLEDEPEYADDSDVVYEDELEYADNDGAYEDEPEYADNDVVYEDEPEYADSDEAYEDEPEYADSDEAYEDEPEYADNDVVYEDELEYEDSDVVYEDDLEYADDEDEYDDDTPRRRPKNKAGKQKKDPNKAAVIVAGLFGKFRAMPSVDKIIAVTGAAVVVIAVLTGVVLLGVRNNNQAVAAFAEVGSELNGVTVIGESGLLAVNSAQASKAAQIIEETPVEEEEETASGKVGLKMTTIVKDLKIKFINPDTDKLIANIPFQVELTTPDKKTETWTNDDKDGVIYKEDIKAGTYKVRLVDLSSEYPEYTFDTSEKSIEVLATITYKKVDVVDEIKTEAQVNAAVEDTAVAEVVEESKLTDTVPFVASSSTAGGNVSYTSVAKSNIKDPGATAKLNLRSFYLMSQVTGAVDRTTVTDPGTGPEGGSEGGGSEGGSQGGGTEGGSGTGTGSEGGGSGTGTTTVTYSVSFDSSDFTLTEGGTKDIKATLTGSDNSKNDITGSITSSDTSVAAVSNGKVTAVKAGSATLTAKSSDGKSTGSVTVTVEKKVVENKVTLSTSTVSIAPTATTTVTATCEGEGSFSASSADSAIATVSISDKTMTIKGVKEGTTTITAKYGTATATCAVTVTRDTSKDGVTLDKTELSVAVAATAVIKATTVPDTATIAKVESADTNVVTVSLKDKEITVKGVKASTTAVNVTVTDSNGKTAVCKVTVTDAEALTITPETLAVVVGKTGTITATVAPTTATITAESSDKAIATVAVKDKVVTVTGVKAGTATITVKGSNNKTATCKVTVSTGAEADTTSKLKDKDGKQVYVLENGKYREAVYADYYKFNEFYLQTTETLYTGWQTINGKTFYFLSDHKPVTGEQIIQGAKYNFASDGSLVTGSGSMGIDVSKWNGSISWNSVPSSGVSYAIVRCGYRGSSSGALIEDPKFAANMSGAAAAGLKTGVYFFTQAVNEKEAVEEASMVLSLISKYKISYPVFLDVESSGGRADGIDKGTRTAVIKAFCQTIQNSGYTAGVYANKTWLGSKMDAGSLGAYKVWLAQYAATPSYTGRYNLWQYSSKGSINGIKGNVDLNISYLGY